MGWTGRCGPEKVTTSEEAPGSEAWEEGKETGAKVSVVNPGLGDSWLNHCSHQAVSIKQL